MAKNLSYSEIKDYKYAISYSGRDYQGVIFGNNKAKLKSLCSDDTEWSIAKIEGDKAEIIDAKTEMERDFCVGNEYDLYESIQVYRFGNFDCYRVGALN